MIDVEFRRPDGTTIFASRKGSALTDVEAVTAALDALQIAAPGAYVLVIGKYVYEIAKHDYK